MNKECDICGNNMYDSNTGTTATSIEVNINGDHCEIQRVKDMFGKTKFTICCCCWLKSLGVKPINEEQKK